VGDTCGELELLLDDFSLTVFSDSTSFWEFPMYPERFLSCLCHVFYIWIRRRSLS
jgi:hypothetical protein